MEHVTLQDIYSLVKEQHKMMTRIMSQLESPVMDLNDDIKMMYPRMYPTFARGGKIRTGEFHRAENHLRKVMNMYSSIRKDVQLVIIMTYEYPELKRDILSALWEYPKVIREKTGKCMTDFICRYVVEWVHHEVHCKQTYVDRKLTHVSTITKRRFDGHDCVCRTTNTRVNGCKIRNCSILHTLFKQMKNIV